MCTMEVALDQKSKRYFESSQKGTSEVGRHRRKCGGLYGSAFMACVSLHWLVWLVWFFIGLHGLYVTALHYGEVEKNN